MNKVILLGRLGKEPELKYTPTQTAVCSFSIATSEKFSDKSEAKQEKTEWHNIVAYGKIAESCAQYLTVGSQVLIEGKLQTRSWEKDGKNYHRTEIIANIVKFLDSKSANNESNQNDLGF